MRKHTFLILWSLLSLFLPAAGVRAVTILPLGDSITQADCNYYSYRYSLWKKLVDAQVEFDFVGSMTDNAWCNPAWPMYQGRSFDQDHEGHFGWECNQILSGRGGQDKRIGYLSKWLESYTPDIVLLHLGTNDVLHGHSLSSTVSELEQIISLLQADNGNVTILLAKVIPTTSTEGPGNAGIIALNNEIDGIASRKQTASSRIIVVDQYQGFDPVTDLYDPWHPNAVGEEKMAQKWFDALMTVLSPGNSAPTVSITSPADGASLTAGDNLTIVATADDSDGTVTKVDFYQGTTLLGTDTTAPYSHTWNNVPAGSYSFTARATDNDLAVTTSAPVGITVTPSGGCTASSTSVEAIAVTTVNIGQGDRQGQASVTVVSNCRTPVANATVTGNFTGSINESGVSAVTNASGVATLTTSGSAKGGVSVTFCVSNIAASGLSYDASGNTETCDSN